MTQANPTRIEQIEGWSALEIRDWELVSEKFSFKLGPLDLKLQRGSILAIMGGSGTGKSMLIKSLFGIIPDGYGFTEKSSLSMISNSGEKSTVFPLRMKENDWILLRKKFWGYLPQDPIPSFDPIKKINRQLSMAFNARGKQFDIERFFDNYSNLGLDPGSELLNKYPHQLSGGQAQRIAFAIAGCGDPNVLVADEPTASLDSQLIDTTIKMILDWRDTKNGTAIISSHDWAFVSKVADEVAIIENGKVCESGDKEKILMAPSSRTGTELKNARLSGAVQRTTSAIQRNDCTVKIDQLSQSYKHDDNYAIKPSSMIIRSNRLGVFGRSGSGKSTVARMISGILQPTSGSVFINEKKIDFSDPVRFEKTSSLVQYIAQDPFSAFSPRRTVGTSILEVMKNHGKGIATNELNEMLFTLMDKCQLDPKLAYRYPKALSGGEKQRFAIIRAIACKPQLIILDEITAALDHVSRKMILDLISDISDAEGFSFWLISHDKSVIRYMCEDILLIEEGELNFSTNSIKNFL